MDSNQLPSPERYLLYDNPETHFSRFLLSLPGADLAIVHTIPGSILLIIILAG